MRILKRFIKRRPALFGIALRLKYLPQEIRSWFFGVFPATPFPRPEAVAFHGDHKWQELAEVVLRTLPVTSIVETGTYKGFTTTFFAEHFSGPIVSAELIGMYYRESTSRLARYTNVRVARGSSEHTIQRLIAESALGDFPLFFLDAHWYDYWPLADELRIIAQLPRAVIMIDDMQVPDRDDFTYDSQETEAGLIPSDITYVSRALSPERSYHLLFPAYRHEDAYGGQSAPPGGSMRGYMTIFQGLDAEFAALAATDFVKNFYREHPISAHISLDNHSGVER